MYDLELIKPKTLADAVAAMSGGAQALFGGQTLLPTLKQRLADPGVLVSLTGIAELQGVRLEDGTLVIGGATPHAVVAKYAATHYPGLAALAGQIGDPAVRNRGTIGGSIANNDPSSCYPAAVLASGATIVTNAREIAADDCFLGMFATALRGGGGDCYCRQFPNPVKGGLCEIRPARITFCAGRCLCREVSAWGAGGHHRSVQ